MKKQINYPKIKQFGDVVGSVVRHATFMGLDENDDPIYDGLQPKPTLTFKGTVKLHGTNAGVSFNKEHGLWAQSRENIITPQKDNAGFAFFVESKKEVFENFMLRIYEENGVEFDEASVTIYGEWAGGNIQGNVAIKELDKAFYLFGIKISPFDTEKSAYWVKHEDYESKEDRIFNISTFETFEIDIDFNNPKLVQNTFVDLIEYIEKECPVAKTFGVSGIGEGIVWTATYKGQTYIFKTKGEKHAGKSKVKTVRKVDMVKLGKVQAVVDKVTPIWRLDQMLTKACDLMNGGKIDRSKMGEFMKLIMRDIVDEEMTTLAEAGLEPKDIGRGVSEIAKRYFFEREQNAVGL
jgi:hypothetical protein